MDLLPKILPQKPADSRSVARSMLLKRAARIGGQLFGQVPQGRNRQFFCLDAHTWIWHEEWQDAQTGERRTLTTRYDVRPDGILKMQDGQHYQRLSPNEARNLYQAARLYRQRLAADYQRRLQAV